VTKSGGDELRSIELLKLGDWKNKVRQGQNFLLNDWKKVPERKTLKSRTPYASKSTLGKKKGKKRKKKGGKRGRKKDGMREGILGVFLAELSDFESEGTMRSFIRGMGSGERRCGAKGRKN